MLSSKLVSIGSFDLKLNHLLVIGVLALSFSISFLLRAQPAEYGFELNEFDPFFNYRATEYIVNHGIFEYLEWNDDLSWYPNGRNVSLTSQVMLHITAAATYWTFGGDSSLYDFTIMFPVVFGSLSTIVLFALVRVIGGTTAGLFASLFFSISIPILIRGQLGWFKSEPLGLFFGLLAMYFLLSGINTYNKKITILKLISAGIITIFGISAWGGSQFFILPIGVFFITLPFLRSDHKFIIWAIPVYTFSVICASFLFERITMNFIFEMQGLLLMGSTAFLVTCILIQNKSPKHKTRNGLIFLLSLIILGPLILALDSALENSPLPSHRYLNAINPFLTTTDPLVDSVSEHATTTIAQSFFFHSVLMIFAAIGIWLILSKQKSEEYKLRKDMISFVLLLGMAAVYTSSTFLRLELFASIAIIVMSSIGLSLLIKEFFTKKDKKSSPIPNYLKISFLSGIFILLMIPMFYPQGSEIYAVADTPPTILTGGTNYVKTTTNDWLDTLAWIKDNTPDDAVIASWWDYGYWISTMGERASLADNATLSTKVIQNIAKILLSSPDTSWNLLNETEADYVVIFVAANQLLVDAPGQFYALGGGGDESKKQWFMRIGGFDERQFLHSDGLSGTDSFWNDTLLGQMIPYKILGYIHPNDLQQQSATYVPGFVGIYQKDVKFPADGDGPLKLVYASKSFEQNQSGPKLVVLVYEVNKDYVPTN